MASLLKRKGGPVEVLDTPQKRAKPETNALSILDNNSGWDAAFGGLPKAKELVKPPMGANGVGGSAKGNSLEVIDFDSFLAPNVLKKREAALKRIEDPDQEALEKEPAWILSEPIGGRNINVDPLFSEDGSCIIIAYRSSIHVYSTLTSLLTRSLKLDFSSRPHARIITHCLSPTSPNLLWVACSDGAIYSLDWTTGAGTESSWTISSTGCIHMTVASMESAGRRRDVVFTTEMKKDGGWRITANELTQPGSPIATVAKTIYTSTAQEKINFMTTANEGSIIVAASGKQILLASLRSTDYDTTDKIKYEFRVIESADTIMTLDVRASSMTNKHNNAAKKVPIPVVDLVVGDVRGSIFVHNDILGNLVKAHDGGLTHKVNLTPRKFHWHRKEVHTVKFSRDGNYLISGGSETVLVLWQLDTGKRQYLPHMHATITKVVVSPSGSSYGIQLADNSTVIISTAELLPTANIAGVQASVLRAEPTLQSQVRRVGEERLPLTLVHRTPAVINPSEPSRLYLAVGHDQEIDPESPIFTTTPFLQTFDLASGHNVSRQALTRSTETHVNIAPNAHLISEPRTTHMQISKSGEWLATVDEWMPPRRDFEHLAQKAVDLEFERRSRLEVYLKFWQRNFDSSAWELVARINAPHASGDNFGNAGRIFDLAVDPSSDRFCTIGEDSIVRTWSTRTRKRDGVVIRDQAGSALRNWICQQAISLPMPELSDETKKQPVPENASVAFSEDGSVLAAAYGKDNLTHFLDPLTGSIRLAQNGLFEGAIVSLKFLGPDLILLSNRISLYDLVRDELRYSVKLSPIVSSLGISQRSEMMHLAVDHSSNTFAVALPARKKNTGAEDIRKQSLLEQLTDVAVFSPKRREPMLENTYASIITALLPAEGTQGYLLLDTQAEICMIKRAGAQSVIDLAQSTSAQQLDLAPAESETVEMIEDIEEEEDTGEEMPETPMDLGDDNETPVVTSQQLAGIFDVGPAFALPPMEEMFYQVAGLFAGKPLLL